jgi:hypothetical protein
LTAAGSIFQGQQKDLKMKDDADPTKRHRDQGNVHKLPTPEMQQKVVQLTKRLEEFADHLDTLCCNLAEINAAIYRACEIAECLLEEDPFDAWEVIQGEKQPAEYTPTEAPDWVPDTFD